MCGFGTNQNPSVSVAWNDPEHQVLITWQGIFLPSYDKRVSKEQEYSLHRYEAVTRLKSGESWSSFRNFGSNVNHVQSGSLNSSDGSIICWSEDNGEYSKHIKRISGTYYGSIDNLSSNGLFILVSNGSNFENTKAVAFNTSTEEPFLLTRCTNDFSQSPLEKQGQTQLIGISYGRSGIVSKYAIEFLFNIGDVILNGQVIKFIERNDTLRITSINQLNQDIRTEKMYLNSQSQLMFSNFYYVLNKYLANFLLSNEFFVEFKCQLIKEGTNEIVGTFEQVTFNNNNLNEYGNYGYLIDCQGIEPGLYYLQLKTTTNEDVKLSLSDIQRDNSILEKANYILRNFRGENIFTDYNLHQNYPNPFNPTTIINYQIKEGGLVTLKLYDILGVEIKTLVNEGKTQGKYSYNFNGSGLASGVYIYQLRVNDFVSSKKLMLLK